MTALINELAAEPGRDEVLLVLDDYHLVDSGPVHESVAFLLENLPPGLRLVVSGRADPPLPLARLRARGQLAELRAAELRFTTEEAAALLGEAAGPGLPDAAVAALTARTEGWAAGLQLAALSLRGHADAAGFVAAFSGSHRFVLDYLADEVLDGQPGPVRAFLLETSVLERLSGELCDAVTGRAGSQAMLAATSSGRACSWCRWMRCAAGGATTTCSPICCAPGCRRSSPAGCRRCTGPRPPGPRSMTWPMTRCGTRWRPGTPPGRRGWSSGTSRRCSAAARARPCAAGFPRCRRSRYATVRACAWPRRTAPPWASRWKRSRPCSMTPSAPLRSAATNRMRTPPGGR